MRVFVLPILLAAVLPAGATEHWHTVAPGESVSGIAKHYYGDFSHTDLLLRFNGRKNAELRPGERLRIPSCTDHRVERGDNGSTLAKRYLGRASAWDTIALLNDLVPEAPLQPGQTIEMPLILRHTLARGDSLSSLAGTYYGDPGRGSLLQAFNGIADPRELSVGGVVEVPLTGLHLERPREEKRESQDVAQPRSPDPKPRTVARVKPPESTPRNDVAPRADAAEAPTLPARFATDFSQAERAYRSGDYEAADRRVEALIERIESIPVAEERSRIWRLAAFVDVAFDRDEKACAAFESMRSTGVSVEFDPELVSPKIRQFMAACQSR